MLSVKNIVKSFHNKIILDNVSFEVNPGEIVVLLGRSGVGKSTILRLLNNLEVVDSGVIELDKQHIDFSKVGMLFQDFNLFAHMSVQDNILVPLIKVAQKSQQEALKITSDLLGQFGLKDQAESYPASLSGGQKQRVALARTLAMNPSLLCLDEPTSALDPSLKVEIAQMITKLAEQRLMVIITTHDIALVESLDCKICLMEQGRIVEVATTKELQQEGDKFEKVKKFMSGK